MNPRYLLIAIIFFNIIDLSHV